MTDLLGGIVATVFLFGLPAVLAAAAVTLLARRTPPAVAGGMALLAVAAVLPLGFAYAIGLGVAGAVLGGTVAATWQGRRLGWPHRTYLALAVLTLIVVPVGLLAAWQIQTDESFDRCAADKAVAVVDHVRTADGSLPANMTEISMLDGTYGEGCYISNGVNWLYRIGPAPGSYTLGYWVDWHVARRVCLHSAGTPGWICGFEAWDQFRPGEID